MSLEEVKPVETEDGSKTLYDQAREISYRSMHGAVSESKYVFLEGTGLVDRIGPWRVAELGFGAAVNFVQTVRAFRETPEALRLIYHSIDWRPVTAEHIEFHDDEGGELARRALKRSHGGEEGVVSVESEDAKIRLHLHAESWEETTLAGVSADAFYQDPFSKRVNPEAWSEESFRRAKQAMASDGRLATYSAASSVKRAMFEGGLWVASAPGPGRKREMTVASPVRNVLEADPRLEVLDRQKYLAR